MIIRALSISLAVLLLAAPAFAAVDRGDEIQAPRARDEVQAPVTADEIQAPRAAMAGLDRSDEIQAPRSAPRA